MDAFEVMGLPRRSVLAESDLQARYDQLCKGRHPDAGGSAKAFEELEKAHRILGSERSRLAALLGEEPARGAVPGLVMEFFPKVAGWVEQAEAALKERREARSALVKAMGEAKMLQLQQTGQELAGEVAKMRENVVAGFEQFDRLGIEDQREAMAEAWRTLGFLDRWQQQLNGTTQQLFQAMLA